MTSSSVMPFASSSCGATWTTFMSMRSPQITALATPGTRSRRARIFQYAVIDWSITETSFDEMPIFITRLVDESGCSMIGGAAHVGRFGATLCNRSCTSCRERIRSVPGSKMSSICESWPTDLERSTSSAGMPASACSRGTVTRVSVSSGVSPRVTVWISTFGGANSGNTSTGMSRSCVMPNSIIAPPRATTRKRNRMLVETIQRIIGRGHPAAGARSRPDRHFPTPNSKPHSSAAPTVTTGVPAAGPDRTTATSPSMRSTSIGSRLNTSVSGLA